MELLNYDLPGLVGRVFENITIDEEIIVTITIIHRFIVKFSLVTHSTFF